MALASLKKAVWHWQWMHPGMRLHCSATWTLLLDSTLTWILCILTWTLNAESLEFWVHSHIGFWAQAAHGFSRHAASEVNPFRHENWGHSARNSECILTSMLSAFWRCASWVNSAKIIMWIPTEAWVHYELYESFALHSDMRSGGSLHSGKESGCIVT